MEGVLERQAGRGHAQRRRARAAGALSRRDACRDSVLPKRPHALTPCRNPQRNRTDERKPFRADANLGDIAPGQPYRDGTDDHADGPARGDLPTDLHETYYAQRAGAGLIVAEGTYPEPARQGLLPHAGHREPCADRRLARRDPRVRRQGEGDGAATGCMWGALPRAITRRRTRKPWRRRPSVRRHHLR
ncbi:hypothetical protein ACU4GD_05465 [Cupriavidus basilensis]